VKKNVLVIAIGLVAMFGLSMAAFGGDPQIELTGVAGTNYGGYYTGIYDGTLNGTPAHFICDDATHEINVSDVWNTNTFTLAPGSTDVANTDNGQFTSSSMTPTYHYATAATNTSTIYTLCPGGTCSLQDSYDAVAYLAYQILSGAYTDNTRVSAIQYAIWEIMDGPPPGPGNNSAIAGLTMNDTGYWIYNALKNESNYSNPGIVFYSPDGFKITAGVPADVGLTAQEFISYNTPTPEPRSLALMGTVLALGALILGRQRLFA